MPATETDLDRELASAERRISQLESALMRRNELLEQKHAALMAIHTSAAWQFARAMQKFADRVLPLHSRRRNALKTVARRGVRFAKWALGKRSTPSGLAGGELGETCDNGIYHRWIKKHEPDRRELERQRGHVFARRPVISVVVPVYNTPPEFLDAMVASVLEQTYSHWGLCLADGASTGEHVRPALERFASADDRIKVKSLSENAGIVGNTNAAIEMATGDYVAFLDHDDTLAPFALHEVASAVNDQPEVEFLYSDEDKLNLRGIRAEPNFKPDWSPETLRSRNYICHLTVMRRDFLTQLGGLRDGFDGAQDHDLVLRASEEATRIVHIPKILYHWRMHEQSTAAKKSSKAYAFDAGKKAVAEHLHRQSIPASVTDGPILGTYHVIYHLPTQPLVSVIIPNKDQAPLLNQCVKSLTESSYANHEIIIAENGSTDEETLAYYSELKAEPHVRIVEWEKPFNYASVNNFAATHAKGELLLFLNNDIEAITPDWLEAMVKQAIQPGVGAVGAKLYYADDTIQHAGIILGMGGIAGHSHLNFPRDASGYMQRLKITQNCAAVTGACLMVPRAVFEKVGGFDEGFVLAFNDVDLCVQIMTQGYRVVWTPESELYHLESKTRGYEDTPEKQERFRREIELFRSKWADLLDKGDPYYSPHFRLDRCDWCLKT